VITNIELVTNILVLFIGMNFDEKILLFRILEKNNAIK
jgi:hypothetical protein